MEEKIQKWEREIAEITEKQKEMNQKYNERIRDLRRKIEDGERLILQKNNEMIAQAVREIYGEVTQETLGTFKDRMKSIRKAGARAGQDGAGSAGA